MSCDVGVEGLAFQGCCCGCEYCASDTGNESKYSYSAFQLLYYISGFADLYERDSYLGLLHLLGSIPQDMATEEENLLFHMHSLGPGGLLPSA